MLPDVVRGESIINMSQIKHLMDVANEPQRHRRVAGGAIWYNTNPLQHRKWVAGSAIWYYSILQDFKLLIGILCGAKLRDHILARWQMRFLNVQNPKDGVFLQRRHCSFAQSIWACCVANDIDQTIDCMQTT